MPGELERYLAAAMRAQTVGAVGKSMPFSAGAIDAVGSIAHESHQEDSLYTFSMWAPAVYVNESRWDSAGDTWY